jgi:hypothetical protein
VSIIITQISLVKFSIILIKPKLIIEIFMMLIIIELSLYFTNWKFTIQIITFNFVNLFIGVIHGVIWLILHSVYLRFYFTWWLWLCFLPHCHLSTLHFSYYHTVLKYQLIFRHHVKPSLFEKLKTPSISNSKLLSHSLSFKSTVMTLHYLIVIINRVTRYSWLIIPVPGTR